jgi:hypothetical protein
MFCDCQLSYVDFLYINDVHKISVSWQRCINKKDKPDNLVPQLSDNSPPLSQ